MSDDIEPTEPNEAEELREPAAGDYLYLHGPVGRRYGAVVTAVTQSDDDCGPYVNCVAAIAGAFAFYADVPARKKPGKVQWYEWISEGPGTEPPRAGVG